MGENAASLNLRPPNHDRSTKPDYFTRILGSDPVAVEQLIEGAFVNAAVICCDRHAGDEKRLALRYVSASGENVEWSFAQLKRESERVADLLCKLGIAKGDCVAGLLPRTPELIIAILATWRLGAVYQPLFTAFGPKAIEHRVMIAGTKVVITNDANRHKISPDLGVAVINTSERSVDVDFWQQNESDTAIPIAACSLDDPIIIMFTSGTTGPAKPLLVPLKAIAAFIRYMIDSVDLLPEDKFWNLADPGWAYGLYYAVVGPLALGVATTFYDGAFSVNAAYEVIAKLGITNLAGSPTAFRLMISEGAEAAQPLRKTLRLISSAGEPLNPEVGDWFARNLNIPIFDHYGQTELGMVLCNHHGLNHPVRPGSAGYAAVGHSVLIVSPDGVEMSVGEPGELAIDRTNSPLMWFSGYLNGPTSAFKGRYYMTGDAGELNNDGSISLLGRSDDVITTSGYRVGPFDVESALLEHPAVLESAVVGKPDPERTEIIKAFVILNAGIDPSDGLKKELMQHVRARLSAHAYPREISFVTSLPKTPSGKVQRFLLRNRDDC